MQRQQQRQQRQQISAGAIHVLFTNVLFTNGYYDNCYKIARMLKHGRYSEYHY